MRSRVLVVGGCGYVGGCLVDFWNRTQCYNITVYDNLMYETRFLKKIPFVHGDIQDNTRLSNLLKNLKPDCVVWLAGIVGDGACAFNPEKTKAINTETVKWLADNYCGKIIFPSTCSVYGANNDILNEESPVNPLSVYAETKLQAEQYLLKNRPDSLIFRLGTLYGKGDEHSRIRMDLVVNVLTKNAVFGEKLKIFGGSQWRPLLHVKDVGIAMEYGFNRNISGLYNIHSENATIKKIAQSVVETVGYGDIEYTDIQFQDARNYKICSDKIIKHGWRPMYNINNGISEIAEILKSKRIKNADDPVYYNAQYIRM